MGDLSERHPSIVAGLARLDVNPNLPQDAQILASRFTALGHHLAEALPDHPDTAEALRKLWEAKNCAVYVAVTKS